MRVTINYTCDWVSENGDDSHGPVTITTPTGKIEGRWSCTGGMGDGTTPISNTAKEFDSLKAEKILDCSDLCQGIGAYDADLNEDEFGWAILENVVWHENQ